MQIALSAVCARMPEEDKGDACELLKRANDEPYIEDKLELINMILSKIPSIMGKGKDMKHDDKMPIDIYNILKFQLNKEELKELCFEINIDYDNLGGETKSGKIRELLLYLKRNNRLDIINNWLNNKIPGIRTENYGKSPKEAKVPYSHDLISVICESFSSFYQKERKQGESEANSKTLIHLKEKLHDLTASQKVIRWLDIGCGDGRCLEVVEKINNRGNIIYHGIDSSNNYMGNVLSCAKKYDFKEVKIKQMDVSTMKCNSRYDLISAVLLLHEIDPLRLPYALRNMLRALKKDGTLILSDFEGPYEQEKNIVAWSAGDIKSLLEKIGGAGMSIEFVKAEKYSSELGFYRCYVKKLALDESKFDDIIQNYGNFLVTKKEESKNKRNELRSQIDKKVHDLLKRPDIDTKNITQDEMNLLLKNMGEDYGIKAYKIKLFTSQIEFLDDKIREFNDSEG